METYTHDLIILSFSRVFGCVLFMVTGGGGVLFICRRLWLLLLFLAVCCGRCLCLAGFCTWLLLLLGHCWSDILDFLHVERTYSLGPKLYTDGDEKKSQKRGSFTRC